MVNAIRGVHPNTPILIFGGHSHIRDCGKCVDTNDLDCRPIVFFGLLAVLDGRTIALQSGRYMETLGRSRVLSPQDAHDT